MGLWQRFSMIFKAKASKALDRAEDPRQTLDYSYERQLEMLTKVRRGVADVATSQEAALEEGTGRFMEIYVVFPLDGVLYLGRGGIYTQYEFTQPTSDRLTDEQWRDRLNSNQLPPLGDWKTFIAP